MAQRPWVVGLTGGIASGKSAVADHLAHAGAALVDTDVLARNVTAPGSAGLAALIAHFGPSVCASDGSFDRRAMRARAFADPAARLQLEAILHPRIREAARAAVLAASAPYVVLAVPLLVESGQQYAWVDRVLVVDADESAQRERLMARDHIDAQLAQRMLAAQATRAQRLALADDIVRNSAALRDLARQAECCHRRYLTLAAQAPAG